MLPPDVDHTWSVRVQRAGRRHARAYARGQSFDVCDQASVRPSDPHPTAVECLLGALGADLVCGFEREAERRGIALAGLECAVAGRLNNVLVHLGVVGERGHPGFEGVEATVYVSSEADESAVHELWEAVLARSPLFTTLSRSVKVNARL